MIITGDDDSKRNSGTASREPVVRTDEKPLPLGSEARMNARLALTLVLTALGLWTAASFLPALIWATILAVALWPLYLTFSNRFLSGSSTRAALVFTILVALVLATPISLAVYEVAQQSDLLGNWLKRAGEGGIEVPDWIAR
jgi:predicted PurR-regulated permease PerM